MLISNLFKISSCHRSPLRQQVFSRLEKRKSRENLLRDSRSFQIHFTPGSFLYQQIYLNTKNYCTLKVDWMDKTTRNEALDKLNGMEPRMAYPEELLNISKLDDYYKNLIIDSNSLLKTELNVNRFLYDLEIQSIDRPLNSMDWDEPFGSAATTNAFYSRATNTMSIFLTKIVYFKKCR